MLSLLTSLLQALPLQALSLLMLPLQALPLQVLSLLMLPLQALPLQVLSLSDIAFAGSTFAGLIITDIAFAGWLCLQVYHSFKLCKAFLLSEHLKSKPDIGGQIKHPRDENHATPKHSFQCSKTNI